MSLEFLAAAAAAIAALAAPESAVADGDYAAVQESRLSSRIVRAVATAAAAVALYEHSDDPLEVYPLQFAAKETAGAPRFGFGGVNFSFTAFSPRTQKDPLGVRDFRSDSRVMSRVVPGYPQPAQLVVGVKINF